MRTLIVSDLRCFAGEGRIRRAGFMKKQNSGRQNRQHQPAKQRTRAVKAFHRNQLYVPPRPKVPKAATISIHDTFTHATTAVEDKWLRTLLDPDNRPRFSPSLQKSVQFFRVCPLARHHVQASRSSQRLGRHKLVPHSALIDPDNPRQHGH